MNNKENWHNLKEDIRKAEEEQRRLDKEKAKKARHEELSTIGMAKDRENLVEKEILSQPQEILVGRLKVSPGGEAEIKVNFYGRDVREGETVILLVGEDMKKVEAIFDGYIKGSKDEKSIIKIHLLNK